jgi:uncharacterized protein (TIGR02145 family)
LQPSGLVFDAAGNLYVGNNNDYANTGKPGTINKITPSGTVTTFATLGIMGYAGAALAFDSSGNLYSGYESTVNKITPSGTVSNMPGYYFYVSDIALDNAGNLYVANYGGSTISKITPQGKSSIFMSLGGIRCPTSLGFDIVGNLYTANNCSNNISKISSSIKVSSNVAASWTITGPATITGSGVSQSYESKPAGIYTITWGAVAGYNTPATQSFNRVSTLDDIAFSAIYVAATPPANCGTVSDADGNIYNTVVIGDQCWMADNLRTTKKSDGTDIAALAYCNPLGCGSPWGRLYDWSTAMNGAPSATAIGAEIQGICPTGWHIPSDFNASASDDFQKLATFLGGNTVAGGKMKRTEVSTYWNSPNIGADNSSGFSGVAAGNYWSGVFDGRGLNSFFWSSSQANSTDAWNRYLKYNESTANRYINAKSNAFSIRCVKSTVLMNLDISAGQSVTVNSITPDTLINCVSGSGKCSNEYANGKTVTLKATVLSPFVFSGWSGACTGVDPNSCTFLMDSNKAVTATAACVPSASQPLAATTCKNKTYSDGCNQVPGTLDCPPLSISGWKEVAP